jgi:hypothetical protein
MRRVVTDILRVASVPVGVGIGLWTALLTTGLPCPNHFNGALSACPEYFPVATFAVWQCAVFGAGAAVVLVLLSLGIPPLRSSS